ncbi:DUF4030 domain-containing protein [Neobacillus sp. OS1-2]|uniref:DUF4030 domain-containing protein n=1 Tax=Neobacillus sp. OS1-2 TaxID=3070680 RepID=UPI0027DF8B84|nr:DUF4030 domain-containing protein [Neobacillus sp. OS1-2]WML42051.1 DUF4030 domain-containing protein [Neobacillus sp. OS1-2]
MKKPFEDTDLDDSLRKLNSDLMWKTKQKQELKKRIITDIETLGSIEKIKNLILSNHANKGSVIRRLTYSGIALVILVGLFIGSAFISPAMAEVASKIPYLNKIFHSEPINRTIWKELERKGYKIAGLGGNGKHIFISIDGSKQYFQDVHEEVEKIAANILKTNDYDGYKIKVERQIDQPVPSIPERDQAISEALEQSYNQLIKLQFNVLSHGYQHLSPNSDKVIIHIDIPNTEKRIEEIKKIVNESLKAKNIDSYDIKTNKIDLAQREKESKWNEVFDVIFEGLTAKKEYKVTGFAYSFHPAPLQIIIKTSINTTDKDADEKVRIIEETINEFLNSEEIQSKIGGDPYEIIIRGKDKKRIN